MTTRSRIAKLAVATACFTVIPAGLALAVVDYPGGGTWDHGTTLFNVWSNYSHDTLCHTATVTTGGGSVDASGPKLPGETAMARLDKAPWDHGSAFWSTSC